MDISSISAQYTKPDVSSFCSGSQAGSTASCTPDQTEDSDTFTLNSTTPDSMVYDRTGELAGEDTPAQETATEDTPEETEANAIAASEEDLDEAERTEVQQMKETDRKVRSHENAHVAAGSGLIKSSANYQYEKGPDGNLYAVAGEVTIDTSEGSTPEETVHKMERVMAAALAPADPSSQDRQVAMQASAKAAMARAEMMAASNQANTLESSPDSTGSQETSGIQKYMDSAAGKVTGKLISTFA